MTAVVADTHALIWYVEASPQLSQPALAAMRAAIQGGDAVYVSAVSLVEIIYLIEKRRLPVELYDRINQALRQGNHGLVEVSFSMAMADALRKIPADLVPDMPDRMIAATTLHLGLPLVTRDAKIRATTLVTVW